MGKIIIDRKSEWINKASAIDIYIDGEKAGHIGDGESMEYEVLPGEHIIYASIKFLRCKDVKLNITEQGSINLSLSGIPYADEISDIGIILPLFFSFLYYWLELELYILLALSCIPFIYFISFFTFRRDKYLVLKEK